MNTDRQPRRIIGRRTGILLVCLLVCAAPLAGAEKGVLARFRLIEPADRPYYVQIGARFHVTPWSLPRTSFPAGAHGDANRRVAAGEATEWFDVKAYVGDKLHGRMYRSGGVAEFPNISVTFVTGPDRPLRKAVIELATAPAERAIVKRFEESLGSLSGGRTSFLVSPDLAADADSLESLSQMQARHLTWIEKNAVSRR